MSEFEKQVRIALIQQDMTLKELASELGISISYVYEVISGTRKAKDKKQKIIDLLGLDADAYENVDQ